VREPPPRPTIEANLRLLSTVALALFGALILALVLVQWSLVSSHHVLDGLVVPAQQDVARLHGAVGAIFREQAAVSSSMSSAELAAVQDRAQMHAQLQDAQKRLVGRLASTHDEAAADARARAAQMATSIESFIAADDELFASVARYHAMREDFARRLASAQSGLRALTEQADAIAGVVRLDNVVLLRRLARNPSPGLVHELVYGDERALSQCVEDLSNAALDLSALSGRIGLAPDGDALTSIAANEIAQNRGRIADRLGDLVELTAHEPKLAEHATSLAARFADLSAEIGDEGRPDSLLAIRRAILLEKAKAASLRESSARRAKELTADLTAVERAADALTGASSRRARWTARSTGIVVLVLVGAGVAAAFLGARRVRASVRDLRDQNRRLGQLRDELTGMNATLEQQVAERTKSLVERERSLQLVLDSTGDGLLSVAVDGTVQAERSRAATAWFGAPGASPQPVWTLLGAGDPKATLAIEMAFAQLVEDVLPFDLAAAQMPSRLTREGRTLELWWRAVTGAATSATAGVLLVARDVSERIEAEMAEAEARELQDLAASILRDKAGFVENVADARALLASMAEADDGALALRRLHTLKGNAAMFGLHRLAARCHDLENDLAGTDGRVPAHRAEDLRAHLDAALDRVKTVFGDDFLDHVGIRTEDIDELLRAFAARRDPASLTALVTSWRDESVGSVLQRHASQARRIAADLGKEVDVRIEDGGARVPPGELRPLWGSLVHAVRNAVDHGLEAPEERRAAQKPARGRLTLRARSSGADLVVEIEDDGRGIDFEAVRHAAVQAGLPARTPDDLVEALFRDGVTTKSHLTSLSGRGVGMAALRQTCRDLGGSIQVESRTGEGTRLVFRVPLRRVPALLGPASGAAA